MFERFSDRARQVVVLAQQEARELSHSYIGTEHLLLGLLRDGEGAAARSLNALGVSLEPVREQVRETIGQGKGMPSGHIPFTPRAKKSLEYSLREAKRLGNSYIGTQHILLGLLREGEGVAAQVLAGFGVDLEQAREQVSRMSAEPSESLTPSGGGGETATQTTAGSRQAFPGLAGRAGLRWGGRGGPAELIMQRLDEIAGRLAAIERHLGISWPGQEASAPRPETGEGPARPVDD